MAEDVKRYRLGNRPESYPVLDSYVGWLPEGYKSWDDFLWDAPDGEIGPRGPYEVPEMLKLASDSGGQIVDLIPYQIISKDAFPLEFYGEERAKDWTHFLIVGAAGMPDERFIIPMY